MFLSSVFWCFLCWDGRKMRQQKSKWNKMGSFFLVCWLGCLSLCLFICLIVLVLDGFSIYCFFCFCFAQSCVCSLLFVFGLFWGCLTDWLIMLVHHVWLYVSCIAYLATSLLVRLLVCLLLFFWYFLPVSWHVFGSWILELHDFLLTSSSQGRIQVPSRQ